MDSTQRSILRGLVSEGEERGIRGAAAELFHHDLEVPQVTRKLHLETLQIGLGKFRAPEPGLLRTDG